MPDSTIRIRIDGSAAAAGADRVKRGLTDIDSMARTTTQTVSTLNRALAVMGASLSLGAAFSVLSTFEQSMVSVRAITRATGSEFDQLREKAKELGAATRFSTSEAAEAMRFLGQAGFSTTEILQSSYDVLSLAQAGGLGLADAAEISSKALRAFQLDASRMNEVADLMAKVFTAANTNVQELGEAFKYAAPVATGFGVSMTDTAAAIAALSDAGISASMAGTSLRGIMTRLTAPTAKSTQILNNAGLSVERLNIKTRGLIPVLEDLAKSGISTSDAMEVFGLRAGPGFEVLAAAIPKLLRFSKEWADVGGFAKDTAKIMDDNLQGAFKRLTSALEYTIIQGAETTGTLDGVATALDDIAVGILAVVDSGFLGYVDDVVVALGLFWLAQKASALWTGTATGVIATQVALLQYHAAAFGVGSTAIAAFSSVLSAARAGVMAFGAALATLAANPVFWVVAIGAGLYTVYQQFKDAEEETNNLRNAFRNASNDAKVVTAEMKALQETGAQIDLTKAQADVATASKNAEDRIRALGIAITGINGSARSAGQAIEVQLATISERFFGMEQSTMQAGEAIRRMFASIQNAPAGVEKVNAINMALRTMRTMLEQNPDNAVLKKLYSDLEAIGGALKNLSDAETALKKVQGGLKAVGETATQVAQNILELNELMKEIGKNPIVEPTTAAEALAWLQEWTKETDIAKMEQYNLEKSTAAASIAILNEAAALATLEGRAADAASILAQISNMNVRIAQVAPPKPKDAGRSRGQSDADKFKQSALDKIRELNLKILQTQYEITGGSEAELAVIELKIQQQKELEDLRRRAAEAGMLNSPQLAEVERLTQQLYQMKIRVAEYGAAWEPGRKALEHQVAVLDKLGIGTSQATLRQLEYNKAEIENNADLGDKEKIRRLKLIDAQYMKIRDTVYGLNTTEQMGIVSQIRGLDESLANKAIGLDQYNLKVTQLRVQLAQLRQESGDATFAENMSLALGGVVENYKGITTGLTQAWSGFFTNFTQGFADSVGRAIVYGDDLGESLQNVAKQAISQLISALVQLGIQWVVMQALGKALAVTATAEAVTAATTLNTIWSPAALMASVATLGGAAATGASALGVAMAANSAMSATMSAAPGFAKGGYTGSGARDTIAGLVHAGEYVMDADTVRRYGTGFFDSIRGSTQGTSATVSGEQRGHVAGSGGTFIVNVNNSVSDKVSVETETGFDKGGNPTLDVIVRMVESRMAQGVYTGNSSFAKAFDETRGTNPARRMYK